MIINIYKRMISSGRISVFAALLLSYLTVLFIPVAIASGLYSRIETVMVDNALSSNAAMIEQVKQIVDSRLEELEQLSRNITTHPKLNNLLRQQDALSGIELYPYIDFQKEMARYRTISSFIQDFYIYFKDSNIVLTPTMKTNPSMFYHNVYSYETIPYQKWKDDILEGYHFNTYLPAIRVGIDYNLQSMFTYVQSLPVGERVDPKGTLVILINEQQIQDLLKEIVRANNGTIYIRDSQGQILLSTGEQSAEILEQSMLDDNVMSVSTMSLQSDWEYISFVPNEVFFEKVNVIKKSAIIMLICCLIIGIIVCSLMAFRTYRPLKEIIQSITQGKAIEEKSIINEYDFIKTSFQDSFEKQTEMQDQLTKQTPAIRANFFGRLVKGYVDPSKVNQETLKFMGITLPHPLFSVVVIKLSDASGFIKGDTENEWALIRFVAGKVAEEIGVNETYSVELEKDTLAIILNMPKNYSKHAYYQWAQELKRIVKQRFRTKIILALSDVHEGLEAVPLCLKESLKALDYSIFQDYKPILRYEEIKNLEGAYYDFPLETEVQLINAVKSGEYTSAVRVIEYLYKNNFENKQMTPELGKLLFSNLISTLFKLLNALNMKYEDIFGPMRNPMEKLSDANTVEELYQDVLSMYEQVCAHVYKQKGDPSGVMLEKIKAFININYADPMLSLVSISDEFQITSPYLSSFFKKNSGINITDYIATKRIEQAKRLMSETGVTITQIAREVGYASDVGFIRVFKKLEGITPGKYKELLKS